MIPESTDWKLEYTKIMEKKTNISKETKSNILRINQLNSEQFNQDIKSSLFNYFSKIFKFFEVIFKNKKKDRLYRKIPI
jgi:hypothetical protein